MTTPKFAKSELAKKAGWFSRRHQSRDEHDAARERYQNRKALRAAARAAA